VAAIITGNCRNCSPYRKDFAVFEPPLHLDGFTLKLAWHRRRDEYPAAQFVAGEVR
jgi:hypothetical protein